MDYNCNINLNYNCNPLGGSMGSKYKVSESELEVLKILWKKQSATSSEVVKELEEIKDWKPKTIQTLINRLVTKEYINVDKTNKKAYIYMPNISESEYKKDANESFLEKLYSGSVNMLISTFIKEKKLSKQDLDELKNMIDE